jgi:methionyl-tRNA synthetase
MAESAFHKALTAIWDVVAEANRYIDAAAPWTLAKTDRERMSTVLYTLAETIRALAILTQPIMPTSMGKILDQLAVGADARQFAALAHALVPGTALSKPEGVFPRYVEPGAEPARGKKP